MVKTIFIPLLLYAVGEPEPNTPAERVKLKVQKIAHNAEIGLENLRILTGMTNNTDYRWIMKHLLPGSGGACCCQCGYAFPHP